MSKIINLGIFLKREACNQTVLPDRSLLIGQKWWNMPKFKNSSATFWVIFKHCVQVYFHYRVCKITLKNQEMKSLIILQFSKYFKCSLDFMIVIFYMHFSNFLRFFLTKNQLAVLKNEDS